MLRFLLLAAILPGLWDKTSPPPNAIKVPTPGVEYRMNEASATSVPWIDSNGWRFLRDPKVAYYYDVAAAAVPLAMAEAYAWQAQALIHSTDPDSFQRMLEFLHRIDRPSLPALANIGLIDDGSEIAGEAMNLLSRRNLLFRVVTAPDPKLDLNVNPGKEKAADPFAYAQDIRQRLGDAKRLVRLYGTDVVIARLTGDDSRARLHLINYSNRKVVGMRVRIRGRYARSTVAAFGVDRPELVDYSAGSDGTEFTLNEMSSYAVIDLSR